MTPQSRLTRERPDIWERAVALAEADTGMRFPHKSPLPDGTVYACGGGAGLPPLRSPTPLPGPEGPKPPRPPRAPKDPRPPHVLPDIEARSVVVPEGAVEWLLHEVGHYVAATPEERTRPNYGLSSSESGLDGDREWQAWAFEEIVLAPWGPARSFAPPSQRDGAAFATSGPMPAEHLRHIEKRLTEMPWMDVEQWRRIIADWVQWEDGVSSRWGPCRSRRRS